MSKSLTLIHEWIGPEGPITNTRVPNIVDLAKTIRLYSNLDQGMDPIYHTIREYVNITLATPIMVSPHPEFNKAGKFIYELEMVHTRVWDTNFKVGVGILDNTLISNQVLDAIRNELGYIAITTPLESFLEDEMLDSMHRYFSIYNIPLSQIIYLTNCPNCKEVYDNYCERQGVTDKLNCEYVGLYMINLVNIAQDPILDRPYIVGPRTKTFLKFNRRYREQRFAFFLEIYRRKILDDFYISFDKVQPEGNVKFSEYAKNVRDAQMMLLSDEQILDLENKLPMTLDTTDFSKFPMESSYEDTIKFYDDSLIHVIAETNFYTDIMHLTEKTMKPIMYKQPFIFVGPPLAMHYVRKLGFKTFSEIWDESYDVIINHHDRMRTVLDLIEKISKMSDEEKIEISRRVKDIVEYNFQQMKNRKPIELYDFVERYGNE